MVDGFISLSFFAATLTFDFLISLEVNKLCLWILERFTISLSIRPIYPEIAQEAGIEGVVVVQAVIDQKGRVKETIILKGIPNTGLDEAAMEAIRKTRFRPAKQRERSVGVWISIPVNFKLK